VNLLARAIRWLGRAPFDLEGHWQGRTAEFRRQHQRGIRPGAVVLLGDSLTESFPRWLLCWIDARCVNRGISGDYLDHGHHSLLQRLLPDLLAPQPESIVLLAGINDLGDRPAQPELILERYDRVLSELRSRYPAARIVCQTLLPTRDQHAQLNASVVVVNRELAALARRHGATTLDLHPHFCGPDGQLRASFSKDGVHLTQLAYLRWAFILRRTLAAAG
jgi:hexosaminidase